VRRLVGERPLAGARQPVVASAAAIDHLLARLRDQTVLCQPVERAIERARRQPDRAIRELLDVAGYLLDEERERSRPTPIAEHERDEERVDRERPPVEAVPRG
jgi:hypothetical protein